MSTLHTTSKLSAKDLREEVRKEYADVALDPHKGYHFHTGRAAADRLKAIMQETRGLKDISDDADQGRQRQPDQPAAVGEEARLAAGHADELDEGLVRLEHAADAEGADQDAEGVVGGERPAEPRPAPLG